jgi:creatinine amidohydrolase
MRSHYWADYTSQELAELGKQGGIAIIPVAAIEQHGPHLPVSVDTCILNGLISASVAKLATTKDAPPALFLPTLPFGKSNEHQQYPGTITISVQTLIALWMEVGRCVAASGFKKIMFYNSHGGQASVMDIVARDLRAECKVVAMHCNWYMLGAPEGMYSAHELRFGIHAGDMETSMMLALDGANVQSKEIRNFKSSTESLLEEGYQKLQVSGAAKISWQTQDLNLAGAAGNATLATAARGKETIDFVADRFVELLQEVRRLPTTYLKDLPE